MDTAFVEAFVNFANWKGLLDVSPFWTRYYWAYLNYNQEQSAGAALDMNSSSAEQVLSDATVQFVNAIQNSTPPTFTAQAYGGAIATAQLKAVTSLSGCRLWGYGGAGLHRQFVCREHRDRSICRDQSAAHPIAHKLGRCKRHHHGYLWKRDPHLADRGDARPDERRASGWLAGWSGGGEPDHQQRSVQITG